MKDQIRKLLREILTDMGVSGVVPDVEISDDPVHGEYTTNVAMRLASQLKKSPMDIALQVKESISKQKTGGSRKRHDQNIKQTDQKRSPQIPANSVLQDVDRVEVAPPGFINFFLTEAKLSTSTSSVLEEAEAYGASKSTVPLVSVGEVAREATKIMVEFAHPNTHKAFHIGHLRNITTGESIVRLLEATRHEVIRVNYQGDVGMHIAKCLYGVLQNQKIDKIKKKPIVEKIEFLGKSYAEGNKAFEDPSADGEEAKKEIGELNKKIYAKDPEIFPLYEETRQWSLDYFDAIYKRVGSHYDRLYFESEFYELGKTYVREALKKGIFEKSDGAIIFPGEKFDLHNRVFITREGNATYEGKEIGLGRAQFDQYHPDLVVHVVGPEQAGYFQVLFKALEQVFPDTKGREHHLIYGWVRLKHGKMSSRTGNVVLGEWLLDEAKRTIYQILKQNESKYTKEEQEEIAQKGAIAAVKYAFLKVTTNQDIAFDLKESVSFDGDSGPYLLYTYARCKSVIRKSQSPIHNTQQGDWTLNEDERSISRLIHFFPDIVAHAAGTFSPNVLCSYLFKLSQVFNLFYQKHPILGNDFRLSLTAATAQTIQNGLFLLGIETAERM